LWRLEGLDLNGAGLLGPGELELDRVREQRIQVPGVVVCVWCLVFGVSRFAFQFRGSSFGCAKDGSPKKMIRAQFSGLRVQDAGLRVEG
jgi:hypothetical protein